MYLWENKCDLMGKKMDFKAYGKLNVILWEEFSYGKINAILWEKNVMRLGIFSGKMSQFSSSIIFRLLIITYYSEILLVLKV